MNIRNFRSVALMSCAAVMFGIGGAYAATTTVTASIKFLTDLTITQVNAPNFGNVKALTAATYVLSTAGGVTGGTTEGGTPQAGNYTIAASTHDSLNIYASGYTNGTTDATVPSLATCAYNGGASQACDSLAHELAIASPVGSATLLVGLTATTTATGADGSTDNPSFTLNVVYQ